MSYSVLEYDFKFCRYRSIEKHFHAEQKECDCNDQVHGKLISTFLYGARSLWWMSEQQQQRYHDRFPFLQERSNVVLSSVFSDQFWLELKLLREKYEGTERKDWLVLGSPSWIKGAQDAEQWCKDNGKDYEVLWGLEYADVLDKLAQAEGFVYLPRGGDTCPRMVIEAKLLGCQLVLNDHVMHKDEIWFETDDPFDTEAYLYAARERFWSGIKAAMEWRPTISGYTTTLDCEDNGYPWRRSVESLLGFCDEVVVVDGGSSDGTWEALQEWSESEERLKVHQNARDWDHPRFAVFDGDQKAYARSLCTGQYCWQQDADEFVRPGDYGKIHRLATQFPAEIDIVSLPVVEFWGSEERVRMDVTPWKWRLSRNKPHITHGIPGPLRKYDDDGNLYASLGTDGCDYIHTETGEPLPHASFYPKEAHELRMRALSGEPGTKNAYQNWFQRNVDMLPAVLHYSWFDLERKIRTYRDYWQKHWESLYDIKQEDTAENNMFFQKPWSEVTDENISELAVKLASETGGHIFHTPIDWSRPTSHLNIRLTPPNE
jgi:glycosyltransferase involved in cell wall biosynthesis